MNFLSRNKASLFLMELIIVILFFSITSTICLKIFVEGEVLSKKSKDLTNAVVCVESAAQLIKNGGGDMDVFQEYYPSKTADENTTVLFNGDFEPCIDGKNAKYKMTVTQSLGNNNLILSDITMGHLVGESVIYNLQVSTYKREAS